MDLTTSVKRIIASAVAAIVLLPCFKLISSANAQYVEAPTIFENGVRKSTQLTVHFKENVFDLPQGIRQAQISDIDLSLSKLREFFDGLQSKHGDIEFVKVIPDAKWGDVWRRHKRTGETELMHRARR